MAMAVVGQRANTRHVMAFHNPSSSPSVSNNQHVGLLAIPVSGSIIGPVTYASETPDRPIGYGAFGVVWRDVSLCPTRLEGPDHTDRYPTTGRLGSSTSHQFLLQHLLPRL
ncbi:hypothetical protein RRG08_045482 [Elysia crispata]|uniref:Uncharacterized protein n=1 Tax=Elysia crispata TaxID=231223 RepID=A0AAE1AF46_9GAST|nr:hypothetical protein RRG08_045482 [Elysia crispata]